MALPQAASNAAVPAEFCDEPLSNMNDPKDNILTPIALMQDLCRILSGRAPWESREAFRLMSNAKRQNRDALPANPCRP
jgi:hypothetical protein